MSSEGPEANATGRPPNIPMPAFAGGLSEAEIWWRDHQRWLEERGYMLRPRYHPDWVPSWHKDGGSDRDYYLREDGRNIVRSCVLDATRISDGVVVGLKQISQSLHPCEVCISLYLSTGPLASDPANHCVPIYEVLEVPDDHDIKIMVMPLLRDFSDPPFLTIGEAMEFFRQAFEVRLSSIPPQDTTLISVRDCGRMNIMMDPRPLYPNLYHFINTSQKRDLSGSAKHYTRTRAPVKYYFIDFGISRKYNPANGPPRSCPILGGDKSVPEFKKSLDPCDPFPTDIYYLGNVIRIVFLQACTEYTGLEFMQPLVDDMVQEEPTMRPNMDQVAARFDDILGSTSNWTLRSRLPRKDEIWLFRYYRVIRHVFHTIFYILTRRPALPRP
ncbi:hypothetical protein ONZ51_g10315 [Trametes cubensis]|uniref:Protein kinase domain-containing protein n=1 Tax=Trametes cubensis TaxID=1111947 RepID=A0AAD7TK14_9APHY|nr:hypothetical protein ONZ51_g10315 [Trametes cubensis]